MTLDMTKSHGINIVLAIWALVWCVGFRTSIPRADAQGVDFGGIMNLSSTPGSSSNPQVAAWGSHVYVVWQDSTFGNSDILFRRSTDHGATFEPVVNLSDNAGASERPRIAIFGRNAYVAWMDVSPGNRDILFRASEDGGTTFGAVLNVSENPTDSVHAEIAAFGKHVYVAWYDGRLQEGAPFQDVDTLFRASANRGATFGDTIHLSDNPGKSFLQETAEAGGSGLTFGPQIAAFGHKVYVAWDDDTPGNSDIFFRRSATGGATFGPIINLSDNPERSLTPSVAAFGSSVYVAWAQALTIPPGNVDVFVRASHNGGETFAEGADISAPTQLDDAHIVTAAQGRSVFVAWQGGVTTTGGNVNEVFFAASTTFGAVVPISATPEVNFDSLNPALAVFGQKVAVVWEECLSVGPDRNCTRKAVQLRASADRGTTFGGAVDVSNPAPQVTQPQVALSPKRLYVTWTEGTVEDPGGEVSREVLFRVGSLTDEEPAAED